MKINKKNPILFIAYTRIEFLKKSLLNILQDNERPIYISIDNIKSNNFKKIAQHGTLVSEIMKLSKNEHINVYVNEKNLGLRRNVEQSVSRILENHSSVIVCEDDVIVDQEGLKILDFFLDKYDKNDKVAHVSIYNRVPSSDITHPEDFWRYSNIPETYIWGTWKTKWVYYDDDLTKNLRKLKLKKIKSKVGTWIGAITWKIHIWEAKAGVVDSWAYRWVTTIWLNDFLCITTNKNYVEYYGDRNGTHTGFIMRKKQIEKSQDFQRKFPIFLQIDKTADLWTLKYDANGTFIRFPIKLIQTIGSIFKQQVLRFKK